MRLTCNADAAIHPGPFSRVGLRAPFNLAHSSAKSRRAHSGQQNTSFCHGRHQSSAPASVRRDLVAIPPGIFALRSESYLLRARGRDSKERRALLVAETSETS